MFYDCRGVTRMRNVLRNLLTSTCLGKVVLSTKQSNPHTNGTDIFLFRQCADCRGVLGLTLLGATLLMLLGLLADRSRPAKRRQLSSGSSFSNGEA
jgi:hypothetical protein